MDGEMTPTVKGALASVGCRSLAWLRSPWLWLYAVVFLTSVLVYAQTLWFDLTYLDDQLWVWDMAWRFKSWRDFFSVFVQRDVLSYAYYRPILNLSFLTNNLVYQFGLWTYHFVNIVLHAMAGCLFLAVVRRLGFSRKLAFFLALIFVVHPTLVGAVAWVPGRTESIVAIFVLASFINFLDCLKDHRPGSYVWHHLFLLAALFSKEVAVVFPVMCWLYAVVVGRRKVLQSENLLFVLGWAIIFAVWLGMRFHSLHGEPGLGTAYDLKKFLTNLPAILTYLRKAFWPVGLAVLPGPDKIVDFYRVAVALGLAGIVFLFGNKQRGLGLFGLIWFLFFLLPGLVVADFYYEYRLYLPLMGLVIALGTTAPARILEKRPVAFWIVLMAIVGALSVGTGKYTSSFHDRISFWEAAVSGWPESAFIQTSLGAVYHTQGDMERAIAHYHKAVEINPREPIVHNNLGYILASRGDYGGALKEYAQEIANNQRYLTVYFNLAELYVLMKEYAWAEKAWLKAHELVPQHPRSREGLKKLYLMTGQVGKAEALSIK